MIEAMHWSYLLGNVLGRGLVSWALVGLVCLAMARGKWRNALALSLRWPAWVAVALLTLGGLAAGVHRGL